MTNEEAIFTIEHRDGIMDYGETEQLAEALDMAIEALEREQKFLEAGYKNEEVEFYIGGRKFVVREVAQ